MTIRDCNNNNNRGRFKGSDKINEKQNDVNKRFELRRM